MIYEVRDSVRTLKFEGILLSESSSKHRDSERWVEFQLYRTPRNQYVLARIGDSIVYHAKDCKVVARNKLSAVPESEVPAKYIPCEKCRPSRVDENGLFPETPRYWAQVSESSEGVLASLMQYDSNDAAYLTNVAKRLLESAAKVDDKIAKAYYVQIVL